MYWLHFYFPRPYKTNSVLFVLKIRGHYIDLVSNTIKFLKEEAKINTHDITTWEPRGNFGVWDPFVVHVTGR